MTPKTFRVDVDGVGEFEFRTRDMRAELRIGALTEELSEGHSEGRFGSMCLMIATIEVLMLSGPEDWDVWSLDPLDDASYDQISAVYSGLRSREDSFRKGVDGQSQAGGEGTGEKP